LVAVQAIKFLTLPAKQELANPCGILLHAHILSAVQQSVELLSDEGRDRMFNGVSALFAKIYTVLREVMDPAQADKTVRALRCAEHAHTACAWVVLLQVLQGHGSDMPTWHASSRRKPWQLLCARRCLPCSASLCSGCCSSRCSAST
jgi:hypothetical protein